MEKPLYPECEEFSLLGFLLELMNVKLGKHDKNDYKTSSDAQSFELDIFRLNGRGIGKKEVHILPSFLMKKAKWFIFNNCQELQPYLEEHLQFLQRQPLESSHFSEMQQSTFPDWFAKGNHTLIYLLYFVIFLLFDFDSLGADPDLALNEAGSFITCCDAFEWETEF
ncbi:hypothetical protein L1987_65084 [Smallanthus sonchifolius]|uniref:Uncharacterized protein n=1 Tax=Smallanthus sonchifolius TaxID=185202 RepID=A0ACB9BTG8_9ASTR|nr:hypothetical protein L1987_65084 [Smallanthus sonchifolius]